MSKTVVEDKRKAATPQPDAQHALMMVGIAPVIFSGEYVRIGRLDAEKHGPIKELREKHRKTHAFRFDVRDGTIANIGLRSGIEPMGKIEEVRVGENLLPNDCESEPVSGQNEWKGVESDIRRWVEC